MDLAHEIDKAAALHHGGQLGAAEAVYRGLLRDHAHDHNLHHLLWALRA